MKSLALVCLVLLLTQPASAGFPTTSVLDNFNRANENPLGNGNWSGGLFSGYADLQITSNQVGAGTNNSDGSWWSASSFGPDSEAYATMSVKPANNTFMAVFIRVASPGTTSIDGYAAEINILAGTDTAKLYRIDDNIWTQIGSTYTQEWSAGDTLGMQAIGSTIKLFRKPSGGSWGAALITTTDSTYSAAGRIAISTYLTMTGRFDDFGGGTYVSTCAAGDAGKMQYSGGVIEFCNGTSWKSTQNASAGACAAGLEGKVTYTASEYRFCDGTNWYSMKNSMGAACTAGEVGKQRYSANMMQFCDGTNWFNMSP